MLIDLPLILTAAAMHLGTAALLLIPKRRTR